MRYIIYGAGAIGGGIGARLHLAGQEAVLIARGEHLEAIRRDGLLVRTPAGSERVPVAAVGHPSELTFRGDDVVVLTMKTQDTEGALRDLEAAEGGLRVAVACAQNGVANERIAARRFGRVYATLVHMPATFIRAGEVILPGTPFTGCLHTGRYPAGADEVSATISRDFTAAGFVCDSDPEVMRLKHAKLLRNLGNALDVILGPTGHGSDAGRAASTAAADEALRCYAAAGIAAVNEEEYRERVSNHVGVARVEGEARSGSSTYQSLLRGRSLEVDYLNGEIALLGALHGVPTPVNRLLRETATAIARQGADATITPEALAALLAEETTLSVRG